MEAFWQDLRFGLRMLAKSPAFTAVAVLTLALGIGANTAIFSVVNGVLLRPLPFPQQERLVMLWEKQQDGPPSDTSFATFTDWRNESQSLENIAAISVWTPTLITGHDAENLNGFRVSASLLPILRIKPVVGRNFLPEEDRQGNNLVVILSHGLWQRRFGGDPHIIGQSLRLGTRTLTVVGVLPAHLPSVFSFDPQKPADIYTPLAYDSSLPWACRTCRHLRAVARLKDGVSFAQAGAELNHISENLFRKHPKDYAISGVILTPLQDYLVGDVRPVLYALLGAVGFVLLIACANVANLLLSRATHRRREVAIRAALGATRGQLLRQFLTESVTLSLAGGALGTALAMWGVELLLKLSPGNIPRLDNVRLDGWVLGFTLAVSILTGLVFGLAPAWQSSRLDLNESLKEGAKTTAEGEQHRLRSLLVITDVALALVLLVGAGLMMKSFVRLLHVNTGFEARGLLTMEVNYVGGSYRQDQPCKEGPCTRALGFYQQVLERVRALPGVESAGVVSQLPLGGNLDMYGVHVEGRSRPNPEEDPSADRYAISPEYLRAMHIPLVRGRWFTDQDGVDAPAVVLVNETFARRFWPDEDPSGKRLKMGDPDGSWRTVVGVVGDVLHRSLDAPHTLQIYLPHKQWLDSDVILVVRAANDPAALTSAVRGEIAAVDPLQPVWNVATMNAVVTASAAQRRFSMLLLTLFAALAMVLAAVGIYGVISYVVAQRTREIGIRVALGALPQDVLRMVLREGLRLALIGVGIGLAGAFGVAQLIAGLLFGVKPSDPLTFAGVAVVLTAVALLACYVPARRATRVDPMVALRYE